MAKGSKQKVTDPVYPKEKAEEYTLLGGINQKVSLYSNGPAEFRDLSNLNFVNLGALTKRPGTTLFGGTTITVIGANPQITSGYEFQRLDGASFLITSGNGNLFQVTPTTIQTLVYGLGVGAPPVLSGALFSFVTFVDRLFAANGNEFYRIGGLTSSAGFNLPQNAFQYSIPSGTSFRTIGTTGLAGNATTGLSGTYVFSVALVNDRGFVGPPAAGITLTSAILGSTTAVQIDVIRNNFLTKQYGITCALLYISQIDGVVPAASTFMPISFSGDHPSSFYVSSATLLIPPPNAAVISNDFYLPALGGTGGATFPPYPQFIPRYLEVYNNQLFMAGFSLAPSTFWWSDIGEPEGVQPNFSIQVRTNDGDIISGMRSYLGSLVISKRKSVHLLTGTDPSNFLLQEISDQYGCVSHRSLVPWNNVLWFLDAKGIIEFNGANLRCVSDRIEPLFNAMNLQAAYNNACGIHVKKYNELWWAIPANGSTINNQIIVYDYVADAWTHYDGVQAQCLFNAYAGFPHQTPFAGNYTAGIVYFDSSLTQDNGQGMTCYLRSLFFAQRGQTTENLYRRFYLNLNPVLGFTQGITITLQSNFGTTVQVARTMYQNPYQSRVDFGLSARSIQASVYHYSTSLPLQINGFAIESRFQRDV